MINYRESVTSSAGSHQKYRGRQRNPIAHDDRNAYHTVALQLLCYKLPDLILLEIPYTMFRLIRLVLLVPAILLAHVSTASAGDAADARAVLAQAVAVVEQVRADDNFRKDMDPYLARARAVMVIPSFYKGGFILGGAYGYGVLTVRDSAGTFSPPAFYSMAGGSIGLQIGGQRVQSILMIMTEKGLESILSDQFKLGAMAGISVATFGANIETATTTNLEQDIIAYAHSQGAYGGGAIEGAAISLREDWNTAIYGATANDRDILFQRRWPLPEAEPLYRALRVAPTTETSGSISATESESMSHNQDMEEQTYPETSTADKPMRLAPVQKQDLN